MKKDNLFFLFIVLFSFIFYIFTAPNGIYTGDSGEITTAVALWGIAHPTGFPLYLILAKLFSYFLPMLDFAQRLNIFSALISSLTLSFLFIVLKKLQINKTISLASVLALTFTYTFWSHATTPQVYSITALFFTLAILIFLHWLDAKKDKYLYLLAIVCGLGVGTHLTFLLVIPFIIIYTLIKDKRLFTIKRVVLFSLLFLLFTTLIYSYIPLRSLQNPIINWGEPNTYQNFKNYITQKDYADKIADRPLESWGLFFNELGKIFTREFTLLGFLIILIGSIITFIKNKALFFAGFSVIIFNIILLGNYGNNTDIFILWRYFLPSYIIMTIFLAFSLASFLKNKKYILISFVFPIIILLAHLGQLNQHNVNTTEAFLDNVLLSLPENSVLVMSGDTFFGGFYYKQEVLHQREDLIIIDYLMNTHPWYHEQKKNNLLAKGYIYDDDIVKLIKNNQDKSFFSLINSEAFLKNNFDLYPMGLVYQIKEKGAEVDIEDLKNKNMGLWKKYNLMSVNNKNFDNKYFIYEIVKLYIGDLNNLSAFLFNNGYYEEGVSFFKQSLAIRENRVALYNLSGIYSESSDKDQALKYRQLLENFDSIER